MRKQKAARSSCSYPRAKTVLVKQPYKSISQQQAERERYDNFIRGSYGACALMCAMFVVLTFGEVFLGW